MPYATLTEMLARYDRADDPRLTQATAPADGVRDDPAIETALADASAEIDTYLGSRYAVPLSGPSAALLEHLRTLACHIALYRIVTVPRAEDRQRYDDALAWLRRVADGSIALAIDGPQSAAAKATVTGQTRRMTRDTLGGVL